MSSASPAIKEATSRCTPSPPACSSMPSIPASPSAAVISSAASTGTSKVRRRYTSAEQVPHPLLDAAPLAHRLALHFGEAPQQLALLFRHLAGRRHLPPHEDVVVAPAAGGEPRHALA